MNLNKPNILYFILVGIVTLLASCGKTTTTVVEVVTVTDSLKVGLVAWYPFDNSALDGTVYGNNGSVYNINSTADRYGKANSAYYFNGYSSYITVNDNQSL